LFSKGPEEILKYVIATVKLFEPEFSGPGVKPTPAVDNIYFMQNYTDFIYAPRGPIQNVNISTDQINSGDFFGITRLDGLDPMIIWGMGGTTGHTCVALWIGDQLNVCESTVNDVYWPTNGIQCTPWDRWLEQARNASFNLVHVPLAPQYSSMFNATAAHDFFFDSSRFTIWISQFSFWVDRHRE